MFKQPKASRPEPARAIASDSERVNRCLVCGFVTFVASILAPRGGLATPAPHFVCPVFGNDAGCVGRVL